MHNIWCITLKVLKSGLLRHTAISSFQGGKSVFTDFQMRSYRTMLNAHLIFLTKQHLI